MTKNTALKLVIVITLIFTIKISSAQEAKKPQQSFETKMDRFTSKTGAFSKFIDTKLPALKISFGSAETRIRKLVTGSDAFYFYQIERPGQYATSTASIEYSDLLEVIKALSILKVDVEKDIATNPDYLENKFVTVDGFQVGYFLEKGKSTWYLKLEKYGTENTVFLKDELIIETAFVDAKAKIESLRK